MSGDTTDSPDESGKVDDELAQFEESLARRLRRMGQAPAPPGLGERGVEQIRSLRRGSGSGGSEDREASSPKTTPEE